MDKVTIYTGFFQWFYKMTARVGHIIFYFSIPFLIAENIWVVKYKNVGLMKLVTAGGVKPHCDVKKYQWYLKNAGTGHQEICAKLRNAVAKILTYNSSGSICLTNGFAFDGLLYKFYKHLDVTFF